MLGLTSRPHLYRVPLIQQVCDMHNTGKVIISLARLCIMRAETTGLSRSAYLCNSGPNVMGIIKHLMNGFKICL